MLKISLVKIFVDYFHTLKNAETNKISIADILVQFIFPILIGIAYACLNFKLEGDVIAGVVATVSALMCAVAIMLYQTRMQAAKDEAFTESRQRKLIDELFSDVVWGICAGFFLVIIIVFLGDFCWIVGFEACLLAHFFLVCMMCLKRINSAYDLLKMP